MDFQMLPQEYLDQSNGVESSDLDKILQYLAEEDPPATWRPSSTPIQPNEAAESSSPRIGSFLSPWLLPPPHVEDLQPYCFSDTREILPGNHDPEVHLTAVSSSLLALQRELLGPFPSDLCTSLIPERGIAIHGSKISPSSLTKSSFQQQLIQSCDEIKEEMNYLPHLDHLSRLAASPYLSQFSGQKYASPPPDVESSGRYRRSNFEFVFGGDEGQTVVNTPNSSSSSSLRGGEAITFEEFSPHPAANTPDDHRSVVSGSKTKIVDRQKIAADECFVKNRSKPARKGRKRVREARFAIQTKSVKDVLEDGYKWRKYGQKAVKNSPHPRSYYRCTFSKCFVKKTVERSCADSGLVITTYEGVHVHPTPAAAIQNSPDLRFLRSIHAAAPAFFRHYNLSANTPSFPSTAQVLTGAQHHLAQLDQALLEDMLPSAQAHEPWLSSKPPSQLKFEA